jgi:hypothetical protein
MNGQEMRSGFLLTALGIVAFVGQVTQAEGSGEIRSVTMTRSMSVFLKLERDLANAVAKHDQSATDALLAEGFELQLASNPAEPTVREDWLTLASSGVAGKIEQLTVHDHDTLSIASFIKSTPSGTQASMNDRTYVVDVWQKHGAGWQLVTRYQSILPAEPIQEQDVAPTGKG